MIKKQNIFNRDNSIIHVHDIDKRDIEKLLNKLGEQNIYKALNQQMNRKKSK